MSGLLALLNQQNTMGFFVVRNKHISVLFLVTSLDVVALFIQQYEYYKHLRDCYNKITKYTITQGTLFLAVESVRRDVCQFSYYHL